MQENNRKEKMMEAAGNYYRQGLNCSECVFKSWLDQEETQFPAEIIALASPFGAGIGKSRNTCGALLGACLAVATVKGRQNPLEKETMAERVAELNGPGGVYEIFGKIVKDFEDEFGSVVCGQLIDDFEDKDSVERKRFCKNLIVQGAGLAADYLD